MMLCPGLLVIPLEGGVLEGGVLEGGVMLVMKTGGTTKIISSTVVVQSIQHALSLRERV